MCSASGRAKNEVGHDRFPYHPPPPPPPPPPPEPPLPPPPPEPGADEEEEMALVRELPKEEAKLVPLNEFQEEPE